MSEWGKYDKRFKIGGVKITIDGSPQGRTAFFTTPYLTGGPGGEKNWSGELTFPQDIVNQMVKKVYDLGVPLILHCQRRRRDRRLLQGARVRRAPAISARTWNVTTIHAQFTRKDQIPKFVEYKIRPSFYTLHTYYFAEAHIANRGKEQAMYISPMRDAIDAGLHPTNHTDFVVAPLDQMFMLWSAVNRISRGGAEIGPDQRVTPLEGLKAMTIWVAEQYGEQASQGLARARQARRPRDPRQEPAEGRPDGDQGHQGRRDDQGRKDDLHPVVAGSGVGAGNRDRTGDIQLAIRGDRAPRERRQPPPIIARHCHAFRCLNSLGTLWVP